ncbi:isocitrate lyase/PEP mutase family protein [Microbispora sp. NPDC046933]|uniref:isocitrate lyase/PEP mutase family protein n=1 Tax=Microbispora sp. NPDC046933 TaxID=3155618 RepID=UPI0033E17330
MTSAARLRQLLAEPGLLIAPGVYDGLSAALVREAGFDAAYLSGAAVAASAVGHPDIGLTTLTEMAGQAVVVTRQLGGLPLIADADTGFGDVINVVRTVREYERAGVAAIQLEDQVFPKRCGHLDDKQVVGRAEFAEKISAAVEARTGDLVIIARTDALAVHGLDEAMARAQAYVEAGADIIFVEAPQTVAQVAAIPRGVGVPVIFNLVPGGKTPAVTAEQLREWGYRIVIAPAACLAAADRAIRASLARLGSGDLGTGDQPSPRTLFDSLGLPFWQSLGTTHAGAPTHG